jgi:hypothetical protein
VPEARERLWSMLVTPSNVQEIEVETAMVGGRLRGLLAINRHYTHQPAWGYSQSMYRLISTTQVLFPFACSS